MGDEGGVSGSSSSFRFFSEWAAAAALRKYRVEMFLKRPARKPSLLFSASSLLELFSFSSFSSSRERSSNLDGDKVSDLSYLPMKLN
jgi:hypothetical protein